MPLGLIFNGGRRVSSGSYGNAGGSKTIQGYLLSSRNWIHLGATTGRGRMDRENKRHGRLSKRFMLIRCVADFAKSCWLDEGDGLWIPPALLMPLKLSVRSCFDI